MTARAFVTKDNLQRTTNWLCTACLKRIIKTEANTVRAVETKLPPGIITHNPHIRRVKPHSKPSAGDGPIEEALRSAGEQRGNDQ